MIELTKEDWVEIYYALDTKFGKIEAGDYNGFEPTESSPADWAIHLRLIMAKIGPDGENMYPEERDIGRHSGAEFRRQSVNLHEVDEHT